VQLFFQWTDCQLIVVAGALGRSRCLCRRRRFTLFVLFASFFPTPSPSPFPISIFVVFAADSAAFGGINARCLPHKSKHTHVSGEQTAIPK